MSAISDQTCPNCGNTVPGELGQHAESLVSGSVTCPHCGATVDLRESDADEPPGGVERATAAPPGHHEPTDSFSGSETMTGVAEELDDKPT